MIQFLTRAQRMFVQHIHDVKDPVRSAVVDTMILRPHSVVFIHTCTYRKAQSRSTFIVQHANNETSAGKNREGET